MPLFDIKQHYQSGDSHDFLVRNAHLGEAFAAHFTTSQATYMKVGTSIVNRITGSKTEAPSAPDHPVVLMQGHGFATVASSIEQAVYQAIFTQAAAKAQTTALTIQRAYSEAKLDGKVEDSGNIKQASIKHAQDVQYLNSQEAADSTKMNHQVAERAWKLWEREVSVSPLYVNDIKRSG